jgi:hypothetical protein
VRVVGENIEKVVLSLFIFTTKVTLGGSYKASFHQIILGEDTMVSTNQRKVLIFGHSFAPQILFQITSFGRELCPTLKK